MVIDWTGDEGLLTMGTGPDHSIFDIYIGGSLWQSYDGYSADPGERVISVPPGELEIRNRMAKNLRSSGHKVGFKELVRLATSYDDRTIQYVYDALARLIEADHGTSQFTYGFDLSGNLVNLNGVSRTYDAANRLVHDGTQALTYDPNGNLTNDGTNSYVWDHANRLLAHAGHTYTYDGDGRRISQTVSSVVTQYLLDTQPGLSVVLSQTVDDTDTTHYIHGPRGLHAVQSPAGDWTHPVTDGLGSVRGYVDPMGGVLSSVHYTEVGVPSTAWEGWAFTGEWRDANALQHHRARYLSPTLATWLSLDPWEGLHERPMSLNGYSWVEGRVVNARDYSGLAPTIDGIDKGDYNYSCHCGWLDWPHIGQGDPAYLVAQNLTLAAQSPISTPYWGIYYRQIATVLQITIFERIALIPDDIVKYARTSQLKGIIAGIYMSANEGFEEGQNFPFPFSSSYFSEEDLPSNLIGLYVGLERYYAARDIDGDIKPQIRRICGAFDKEASKQVFRTTYRDGDAVVTGWKSWYPRLLSLLNDCGEIDFSNTPQGDCNRGYRQMPGQFTSLAEMRIQSRYGGMWWWYNEERRSLWYDYEEIWMSPNRIIGLYAVRPWPSIFSPLP